MDHTRLPFAMRNTFVGIKAVNFANALAIAVALLSAACSTALSPAPEPVSASLALKSDIPKAHAAIIRSLKDKESARFGEDVLKPGAVCGLINSKNSYGGYVGDTPYLYVVATGESFILQDVGTIAERSALLSKFERYCRA